MLQRVLKAPKMPFWMRVRRFFAGTWWLILFGVLISLIAFWGRTPHAATVYRGLEPNYSFSAPFDFTYKSEIKRHTKQLEARYRVSPFYRPDMASLDHSLDTLKAVFKKNAEAFDALRAMDVRNERFEAISNVLKTVNFAEKEPRLRDITPRLAMEHSLLIEYCDSPARYKNLAKVSLALFKKMASDGIYDKAVFGKMLEDARFSVAGIKGMETSEFAGKLAQNLNSELWRKVFEKENSARNMEKIVRSVMNLFTISQLIRPNAVFDAEETQKLQDLAAAAVPEIVETVRAGEPLLQPGMRVTDEILERWRAYRAADEKTEATFFGGSLSFFPNTLYTFCLIAVAVIFCALVVPAAFQRPRRRVLLAAAMILLNLGVIRLMLELLELPQFEQAFSGAENIQVFFASPAIVALITATMIGAPLAIITSVLVGAVVTLMLGGNIEVLLMASVAFLIAIYTVRNAVRRSALVAGGLYSGIAVALTSLLIGLHAGTTWQVILYNLAVAVGLGGLSGILAAGILPVLERIFKITTNISLLELTDYNHPLLRKLQMIAPGTFHHSVMVADYAFKAAVDVGANAELCRCAALYHDIGKTLKPEFFTENQNKDLPNPHDTMTPTMSALIIKSHVREGTGLADEYHLPVPVREIIEQHHGTSSVGFFFEKAKKLAALAGEKEPEINLNFLYDGPKPQTVEAAIMMICDIVEASSRASLKKITPQSVEDWVDARVSERLNAGEFDECPITLSEINSVKKSLVASVLTTFHSRIDYTATASLGVPADEEKTLVRVVKENV